MNPHLILVHFPIAFVLLAAILDVAGAAMGDSAIRDRGWRLLLLGALLAFLAFATGQGARMAILGAGMLENPRLESHELWGSVGVWILAGAALLRTLWRHRTGFFQWLSIALVVLAAGVTVMITVLGTLIRHG